MEWVLPSAQEKRSASFPRPSSREKPADGRIALYAASSTKWGDRANRRPAADRAAGLSARATIRTNAIGPLIGRRAWSQCGLPDARGAAVMASLPIALRGTAANDGTPANDATAVGRHRRQPEPSALRRKARPESSPSPQPAPTAPATAQPRVGTPIPALRSCIHGPGRGHLSGSPTPSDWSVTTLYWANSINVRTHSW